MVARKDDTILAVCEARCYYYRKGWLELEREGKKTHCAVVVMDYHI
jgi:hypothetical protein